ncbi:hypothetical protein F2P81_007814 [Scophthalmus maximus]|uniref:Uncharacterized protein n=1 Tax=Scophthalmus maximus TaxID=52904 RepID=A0A6A4T3W6_SCOMX|nr:hypothetical protein F2P81_007814 [Scophthalmus maximus]
MLLLSDCEPTVVVKILKKLDCDAFHQRAHFHIGLKLHIHIEVSFYGDWNLLRCHTLELLHYGVIFISNIFVSIVFVKQTGEATSYRSGQREPSELPFNPTPAALMALIATFTMATCPDNQSHPIGSIFLYTKAPPPKASSSLEKKKKLHTAATLFLSNEKDPRKQNRIPAACLQSTVEEKDEKRMRPEPLRRLHLSSLSSAPSRSLSPLSEPLAATRKAETAI